LSSSTSSSYLQPYQQLLPQQQFSNFLPSSYPTGSSTYSAVSSYAQQAQQQMQQQMLKVQQQYRQSQPQSEAPEDDDEDDEVEAATLPLHSKSALTYRKTEAPRGPVGRDQPGAAMSAPPDALRARGQASTISYEDPTDEPEARVPSNGPSMHLAGAASVALRRQQQQQQQHQQLEWSTAPTQPLNPVRVPKKKKKTTKVPSAGHQGRPSPYSSMVF
jgi:hypothetical protein